jgi:hypothetical protein
MSRAERLGILAALALGASRIGAVKSVGQTAAWLRRQVAQDKKFAKEVELAEGQAETFLLDRLRESARDTQGWRAAAWLLERRNPEAFGRKSVGVYTDTDVQKFITEVLRAIVEEVRDPNEIECAGSQIRDVGSHSCITGNRLCSHTDCEGGIGGVLNCVAGKSLSQFILSDEFVSSQEHVRALEQFGNNNGKTIHCHAMYGIAGPMMSKVRKTMGAEQFANWQPLSNVLPGVRAGVSFSRRHFFCNSAESPFFICSIVGIWLPW